MSVIGESLIFLLCKSNCKSCEYGDVDDMLDEVVDDADDDDEDDDDAGGKNGCSCMFGFVSFIGNKCWRFRNIDEGLASVCCGLCCLESWRLSTVDVEVDEDGDKLKLSFFLLSLQFSCSISSFSVAVRL